MNDEAKAAFLSAYGKFDEREVVIDDVASVFPPLFVTCQRKAFPDWSKKGLLEKVMDGRLLAAVEKLLEDVSI